MTLGWASVDRQSFEAFAAEVERAPEALRGALGLLCSLYGLCRVEKGLETYFATGECFLWGSGCRALVCTMGPSVLAQM